MRRSTVPQVLVLVALISGGCRFNPGPAQVLNGTGTGTGGTGAVPPPPPQPCTNLACQQSTCKLGTCTQPACPAGTVTTLSGKVYDPAGKVPIYNVDVYVPNKAVAPYTDGPSCDTCATRLSGDPIVKATTDAAGNFKLGDATADVPAGSNIPLVIQVGKWRREVTIPNVTACADTSLIADPNLTRLPRNQAEGHLPKIALTTGGADALECLLRKIGIDDTEFTPEAGPGRVNFFAGVGGSNAYDATHGGAPFTPVEPWWDNLANLSRYDMILHSCEGTENAKNKSMQARQALQQYADMGGRVFASHWHNYWFEYGVAPWPGIANFQHQPDLPIPFTATIDTSFPKGMALAEWLVNVGGSTTLGQLVIQGAQHTINTVGTGRRWIYSNTPQSVQYLDATTPMGSRAACGRVVLSDIHVSTGGATATEDSSAVDKPYPTGCVTTDLSPQEKALEFMIFDLSSCVIVIE
jgi:hypothetical protein